MQNSDILPRVTFARAQAHEKAIGAVRGGRERTRIAGGTRKDFVRWVHEINAAKKRSSVSRREPVRSGIQGAACGAIGKSSFFKREIRNCDGCRGDLTDGCDDHEGRQRRMH